MNNSFSSDGRPDHVYKNDHEMNCFPFSLFIIEVFPDFVYSHFKTNRSRWKLQKTFIDVNHISFQYSVECVVSLSSIIIKQGGSILRILSS